MKRSNLLIIILTMICFLTAQPAWANTKSVTVKIPAFKVSVNDNSIDSRKLKYPLVEYQGITYFLTWQWCKELGWFPAIRKRMGYISPIILQRNRKR